MHVPDSAVSPATSLAAGAAMAPLWYLAGRRLRATLADRQVPLLAAGAAFSFTIMLFNIPMPGGTSAHVTGALLLAVLLGPWAALLGVTAALAIQALFFGDGGVLAIGVNSFTMAFAMPFCGYALYRLLAAGAPPDAPRRAWAAGLGAWLGLNVAALLTALALGLQPALHHDAAGRALYFPFGLGVTLPAMLIPHLLLAGPAEGIVTFLAVRYLQGAGVPLHAVAPGAAREARGERLWIALGVLVALSPLGLLARGEAWGEWSADRLARLAGYLPAGLAAAGPRGWKGLVLFPDYLAERGGLAYALAGLAGVLAVVTLLAIAGRRLARGARRLPPVVPGGGSAIRPGQVPGWMLERAGTRREPASRDLRGGRSGALERTLADLAHRLRQAAAGERPAPRAGLLQRIDPRARIVGLLALALLASLLRGLGPLLALHALLLGLAAASHLPLRRVLARVWLAVPLFVLAFTLPAAFEWATPGRVVAVLWEAPRVALTAEGLALSARLTLRVAAALTCAVLLALATPADDLLAGLRALRVPVLFVAVLGLARRHLSATIEAAAALFTARASRDVGPAPLGREHGFLGGALGALLGRSLALGEDVHAALRARGWTGETRTLRVLRLGATDAAWLTAVGLAALGLAAWGTRGGF